MYFIDNFTGKVKKKKKSHYINMDFSDLEMCVYVQVLNIIVERYFKDKTT